MDSYDAVVVGSGPNGLVAAALLARAGWRVAVAERSAVAGGAVRSSPLTEPGYVHDDFSAFYGMLHASPVLRELGLDRRVAWARFDSPVSAVVAPGRAALCRSRPDATVAGLPAADADAWRELWQWWQQTGQRFFDVLLNPVPALGPAVRFAIAADWGRSILAASRMMVEPMEALARRLFNTDEARALLAAGDSHTDLSIDNNGSVPPALILAMVAQQWNMPVPVGGAGRLAEAMVETVVEAGGVVLTEREVRRVIVEGGRAVGVETADGSLAALRAVLANTGPGALFGRLVGEEQVPPSYLAALRPFRYGTGIFKLDLALDGPPAWLGDGLERCGVVHITGDLDNMARSAYEARHGLLPTAPLLVVGQQSVADSTRAPAGGHTLWIETHVPPVPRDGSWSTVRDAFLERVLDRLEEHAPGLRSRIVGTHVRTPRELEAENPNLVGGDLGSGSSALDQQLVFRPATGWFRYATPIKGLYLCSASAHPGGGVHGMVGRNCARRVLTDARFRRI